MKLISGELVGIREGSYQDKPQYTAKLLERSADGDVNIFELQLDPKHYASLFKIIGEEVVLSYSIIRGRSERGQYTLFVDGRLLTSAQTEEVLSLLSVVPA